LFGWLIRHFWRVGIERSLRDQKLLLQHSQQRAAGDICKQRKLLSLLVRGETERAIDKLASSIAIFYHSWRAQPDLVKDADPIRQELIEIEKVIDSLPSLRSAIRREGSDHDKSE
jgi:hypothetical protein